MKKTIVILFASMLLLAGCGGNIRKFEQLGEMPKDQCINVGHFTATFEASSEIINQTLRTELSKQGVCVDINSPYVVSGSTDADLQVFTGVIKLENIKTRELICVWSYWDNEALLFSARRSPLEFAVYMAKQIKNVYNR